MILKHSSKAQTVKLAFDTSLLNTIEQQWLIDYVKFLSYPRHYVAQPIQNRHTRDWIAAQFESFGYSVDMQSDCDNVVATRSSQQGVPCLLIGAHYDSMPETPGADDNASAVAALLSLARALSQLRLSPPILFVAFNREEEDLMGSRLFADMYRQQKHFQISQAHILEMLGYTDKENEQKIPRGLPIRLPKRGDFLGLVAKGRANRIVNPILNTAKSCLPDLPVLGLRVLFSLDKHFKVLRRSDHAPLWDIGVPSIMWTDTAEFRNPNYHKSSDTPDTLDYEFLTQVTRLLLAHVLTNFTVENSLIISYN